MNLEPPYFRQLLSKYNASPSKDKLCPPVIMNMNTIFIREQVIYLYPYLVQLMTDANFNLDKNRK